MTISSAQPSGLTNPAAPPTSGSARDPLARLRSVVLLGGSTRPSRLARATTRSPLDLPLTTTETVMDRWKSRFHALKNAHQIDCPLCVQIDRDSPAPHRNGADDVRIETDRSSYRGTAGVLRDLAEDFHDDDYLLVGNAGQILLESLDRLATELASTGADVSFFSHRDGTPSSLLLIRCGVLSTVSRVGYVDLKEQAIPRMAADHDIHVVNRAQAGALPIRTRQGYIEALRRLHRGDQALSPFAEDWESTFSIIESGAQVDSTVRIHDSVVLAGAVIRSGAVVVRSVVGPGARLARGRTVVDDIVPPQGSGKERN